MGVKKLFSLVFVFLLSSGINNAQKKSFFFIQMTDPQFGFLDANRSFEKETILYQKAIDKVNSLNPDFVVITGDLVNKLSDSTQLAEFDRITAEIKHSIPVYFSPGNHDIGNNPTQQSIDAYRSLHGDDKFSFKHKKNRFIGFNSCIIKDNSPELEQKQFEWLEKELKNAYRAKNIVLFCHHSFFLNEPNEPEKYFNIGIEKRMKYLELFIKNNANYVFAGHLHKNASGKYGNLSMITTSAVGKQLGNDQSGLRIVIVSNHGVKSSYYPLTDVPKSVNLAKDGHN